MPLSLAWAGPSPPHRKRGMSAVSLTSRNVLSPGEQLQQRMSLPRMLSAIRSLEEGVVPK